MRLPVVSLLVVSCFFIGIANPAVINPASQQQTKIVTKPFEEPVTVIKSAALKSSRHTRAYYVGIKFVVHDLEMNGIGIWLVEGDRSDPIAVYSVNATASVFSKYPKSHSIRKPARLSDHEAKLILDYLKAE